MTVAFYPRAASGPTPAEIERWRNVPVAVAVDVGRPATQIDPAIRPLLPAGRQPRLFGRAVTALCEPPDFGAVLVAIDCIGPGEVLVIAALGHSETAMIGEILSGQLRRRGAAGVVCDGAIRDVGSLSQWTDLSVFTRHVTPRGPWSAERGAVNAPVTFGGRIVSSGDLLIGDADGLAALDADAVRNRIGNAEAKLRLEAQWQANLAAGRSMAETFGLEQPIPAAKPAREAP
ncbi:MAG TPA: dimethylmenaquinone methyltransferase [Roseiarcus sp.]|nr:dimethylmenaquinone methyltransferase [Roseiarcus sp.]